MTLLDIATAIALGGLLPAFAFVGPIVASLGSRQDDAGIAIGHEDLDTIRQRVEGERSKA